MTSPLTRSPISGEISDPNCCSVVRNLLSLLSCLAPQAGGNWLIPLPIFDGDTGPDTLEWMPLTTGELELFDNERTSATTGTDDGLLGLGDGTGGPCGGCAAESVGESGMFASLRSGKHNLKTLI